MVNIKVATNNVCSSVLNVTEERDEGKKGRGKEARKEGMKKGRKEGRKEGRKKERRKKSQKEENE